MRWCALLPRPPEPSELPPATCIEVRFDEQNAGSGGLTLAVSLKGVMTAQPNDVYTGGTDLHNSADVEALWDSWVHARQRGIHLIIHWAPPCSSMSRATQRSFLTRVRSQSHPWGLRNLTAKQQRTVEPGNDLAIITESLAMKAYVFLRADITIENPDSSFIWKLGLFEWGEYTDYRFSSCMLGDEIAKPTRIRAWGIKFHP